MARVRFPSVSFNELQTVEKGLQRKHFDVRFADVNDWQISALKKLVPELLDLVDSVRAEDIQQRIRHLARAFRPFSLVEPDLHMRKDGFYMKNVFLRDVPVFRAVEAGRFIKLDCADPPSQVRRWRDEQIILGVDIDGRDLYPLFQFDSYGKPYPRLRKLLELFRKHDYGDWEIAFWFFCGNGWLDGDSPMDVLSLDTPEMSELLQDAAQQQILRGGT